MLVIFLRGPVEPFAVFIHLLPYRLLYPLDRAGPHMTRRFGSSSVSCKSLPSNKVDHIVCVFFPKFCIVNLYSLGYLTLIIIQHNCIHCAYSDSVCGENFMGKTVLSPNFFQIIKGAQTETMWSQTMWSET